MIINPTCGPAGTSVSITGSGWPEPNPVCYYDFLFNGAPFAPNQPDGLFGPPNATGTVPGGTANGTYKIKTELRLTSDNSLLACRQDTFKVVTMTMDPFNGGANVNPGGGNVFGFGAGNIAVTFNPANVCKVTPCTSIVPIQAIQQIGTLTAGGTRILKWKEQGFDPYPVKDGDVTPAGWSIDTNSQTTPYYTDSGFAGNDGNQGAMPNSATLGDFVNNNTAAYPPDISAVTFNFEDNFFCASGENRGEWLGMATWTWTQTKVQAAASTTGTVSMHSNGNQNQPSQPFFDALSLYLKNHPQPPFPTIAPKQLPPGQGGQPCS